jgi:hypothetical protein
LHGEELIDAHIKSASQNGRDLNAIRIEASDGDVTTESRVILGKAAKTKKAGWFKSITWMEDAAREIIGPDLSAADSGFTQLVNEIFAWVENVSE